MQDSLGVLTVFSQSLLAVIADAWTCANIGISLVTAFRGFPFWQFTQPERR